MPSTKKELPLQNELIEIVLDSVPNLIFVKNRHNQFTMINKAVEELFGLNRADIVGKNNKIVHKSVEENVVFEETDIKVLETKEPITILESFTRSNGEERWYKTTKRAIFFDGDYQILGISVDVTDQLDYEERLKKALVAEKQFIASMSHEIRTPLNSIMGYLELLKEEELKESAKQFLQNAEVSAKHLFSLINDILDISKIEAGQLDLSENPFDFDDLLFECGVIISNRVAKDVALDIVLPRFDFLLLGDSMRIKQIFVNLLGNSAKFTSAGEIKLSLKSISCADSDLVELFFVVEDSGVGIAKTRQQELFKPFRQLHSSQYEGTGLGLYLTKALLEKMHGTISVESDQGKGTRITVSMKLKKGKQKPKELELSGVKILLISDDPSLDLLMEEASNLGASVRNISPKKAGVAIHAEIERVLRNPVDLALLAGDELEEKTVNTIWLVRDLSPKATVVAINASASVSDEADRVVKKPLFLSTLRELLAQKVADKKSLLNNFSDYKVLLVEDVELNAELALEMFKRYFGVELEVAKSAEESIWRLKRESFDLVFMDIQLPQMSGIEATKVIRGFNKTVPIVALSANAFKEDVELAKNAGMNDYLTKPIIKEQVAEALAKFLITKTTTIESKEMGLKEKIRAYFEKEYSKESANRLSEIAVKSLLTELRALKEIVHSTTETEQLRLVLHRFKGVLLNSGFAELAKQVAKEEQSVRAGNLPEVGLVERVLIALEIDEKEL